MSDVQVDFENDIQKKDLAFQKQAAHNTTNVFFHGQGFFWCFTLLSKKSNVHTESPFIYNNIYHVLPS